MIEDVKKRIEEMLKKQQKQKQKILKERKDVKV